MSGENWGLPTWDPEMLQILAQLQKQEREALENQIRDLFESMKYLSDRARIKLQQLINITGALKKVPTKEKVKFRRRVIRILRYIQDYEMQKKSTEELESILDMIITDLVIVYQRDIRETMLSNPNAELDMEPDFPDQPFIPPAQTASFTDELSKGRRDDKIRNLEKENQELQRKLSTLSEQLRLVTTQKDVEEVEFVED